MGRMSTDERQRQQAMEEGRRVQAEREKSYRERALKLYPWVCGKCGREFAGKKVRELTVHHRDHNHDNNPPDGSNWELLCIYCHDNEHSRGLDSEWLAGPEASVGPGRQTATHNPFAALGGMLSGKKE